MIAADFNWVDGLLVFVVLLGALNGWRSGFVLGTLGLVRWIGSLVAAWWLHPFVADVLARNTGLAAVWQKPAAFLLVVVAASAAIGLIGGGLLRALPAGVHRHGLNRLLGILPGLANGLIAAALLAVFLWMLPLPERFRGSVQASPLAGRLVGWMEQATAALVPIFDEAAAHALRQTAPKLPEPGNAQPLPFKVEAATARPALEEAMLELVNRERAAAGLKPLAMDPALIAVSRRHSADMLARGYFSHENPDGKGPFDRMREASVGFLMAGENLALARSVPLAHAGLMNSPGHRENILQPRFGRVGIGIMDGGIHGLMVTQTFRN
jgi:uncharacterized protein YkwD